MDLSVEVYLDRMVQFDKLLMPNLGKETNKKQPNFMKSNSLGLLGATEAHETFGPACLHWEGVFMERKRFKKPNQLSKSEEAVTLIGPICQ